MNNNLKLDENINNLKFTDFLLKIIEKLNFEICFGVTGGFAMHLNDSFGKSKITNIYNHHEQASIFSAIGYFKSCNKIPIVSTTAGCGVTNTITGIMDCWQDSIPCLIISGQTKSFKTISYYKKKNINIRHYSGQDVDIVDLVKSITKYSMEINLDHTLDDIINILSDTFFNLLTPRYGPVLLSIPLDIQSLNIDNSIEVINKILINITNLKNKFYSVLEDKDNYYSIFNKMLKESNNPLILVGGGIKTSKCEEKFLEFIEKYQIPIVTTYSSIDILQSDNKLYMGRIGIYGERLGNYCVQKCDLLIIICCRLSETTLGYNEYLFNNCKKIVINIDDEILKIKKTNVDLFIEQDINIFLNKLPNIKYEYKNEWIDLCKSWKNKFFFEKPLITDSNYQINPYDFFEIFSDLMSDNSIIIPAAGSIFYILRHMIKIKEKTKVIMFSQQDLGYEIPCSIGAYFGNKDNGSQIYCFNGDGSIQFNIQELQTIKHYNIPIKIIIFNNHKYGCIEVTQKGYFGNTFGVCKENGLSFPEFKKIAYAYDIDYLYINSKNDIKYLFDKKYENKPIIIEIEAEYQDRHPKLGFYIDEDNKNKPTPFDKMNPQIK